MPTSDFLKIEHDRPDGRRIHLVYKGKPPMLIEFQPGYDKSGNLVSGSIRRICLQNSVLGDNRRCGKVLAEAEKAFRRFLVEPDLFSRA